MADSPRVTIKGRIAKIMPVKEIGTKKTPLTELVIECGDGKYPNPVPVTCYGSEHSEAAQSLSVGDEIAIECYVQGRTWNDRVYVSLKARHVEAARDRAEQPKARDEQKPAGDDNDQIPF